MRALTILLLLSLTGCVNTEKRLKDLTWGEAFKADYDTMVQRAKWRLNKDYPGLNPDLTNEEDGDFYTLWDFQMAMGYRKSKRFRARVKVQDEGDGMVRLGVAVISQLNDNIDNPHSVEEARWVKTTREVKLGAVMEQRIARRYLKAEPSEVWKEKHKDPKEKKGLRQDLVDRYSDVDMGESGVAETPTRDKD